MLVVLQRLMRDLEEKEKDLNKLKSKVDLLLKNKHPASDKIQVRSQLLVTSGTYNTGGSD